MAAKTLNQPTNNQAESNEPLPVLYGGFFLH